MTTTTTTNAISRKDYIFSVAIIGLFFFIFGFVTWLNGILIPFLRTACELNDFEAYFVTFAFYVSYLVMALPSSMVLKRTGFKNGMSLGLWIMAAGALIFIPAAMTRTFSLFLLGLFVRVIPSAGGVDKISQQSVGGSFWSRVTLHDGEPGQHIRFESDDAGGALHAKKG